MSDINMKNAKPESMEACKMAQPMETTQDKPVFQPPCDIYEKEDRIVVLADMPGVLKEHVDIQLENDQLVITGTQEAPTHDGLRLIHAGCPSGIFRRAFTILADVDGQGIQAKLSDGVLRIEIPKLEKPKPRKIKVEAA